MVTFPVRMLFPDRLRRPPEPSGIVPIAVGTPVALKMPEPVTVMASAIVIPPERASAAPLATVVPPAVLPSEPALVARTVPALNVFTPE